MKTYELTYIISSRMGLEESDAVKKDFETFLQSKEGAIVQSQKSQAQTLAYPIKKQSSGYFVVTDFKAEEALITEIKAALVKNASILRHFLIVKRPAKIMKERRTRKPLLVTEDKTKPKAGISEVFTAKAKKAEPKVEDIDKKLDEILSE